MMKANSAVLASIVGVLFLMGCDPVNVVNLSPSPVVRKTSALREIATIPKSDYHPSILTKNGLYYANSDGIHQVLQDGHDRVFVPASLLPEFVEALNNPYGVTSYLIDLSNGEIVFLSRLNGENRVQWIGKDGSLISYFTLKTKGDSSIASFLAADPEHLILRDIRSLSVINLRTANLREIFDGKERNDQKLNSVSVIGKTIYAVTGAFSDSPSISKYDLAGARIERVDLNHALHFPLSAPGGGILDVSSVEMVSDGVAGFSIRTSDFAPEAVRGFYFYAFSMAESGLSDLRQIGHVPFGQGFGSAATLWNFPISLGGFHFAWRGLSPLTSQENLAFVTLDHGTVTTDETLIKRWDTRWSGFQRTEDGSVAMYEYSAHDPVRLMFFNADGSPRLSYLEESSTARDSVPSISISGSYVLIDHFDRFKLFEIVDQK